MLQTRVSPVAAELVLAPGVTLARARAHEVTGPARAAFALLAAGLTEGPVLWIRPDWTAARLLGDGLARLVQPGRLIFAHARRPADALWAAEEALRSGAAPLVVADLTAPPALLAVRRLHLAAEAGSLATGLPPLALLLTPGFGGAPGVETRWRLDPAPGWAEGGVEEGCPRWHLSRLRARMAPEARWPAILDQGRLRLGDVSS